MAFTLTRVLRWICQNSCGIELVDQLLDRLADQRLDACAVCTRVYFSSEMKNSTSSTGIIWMLLADAGLDPLQVARAPPGFRLLRQLVQQLLHAAVPTPSSACRAARQALARRRSAVSCRRSRSAGLST
jgi:hypothetical protein